VKLFSLAFAVLALALLSCEQGKRTVAAQGTSQPAAPISDSLPYLTNAQPRLQTMKLYLGAKELKTELAMKPIEIYTGMMWRTNMPEGEAMLFVFPGPDERAFYMRNTYVPLSVAYIDPEGAILEIYDLQPRNETSVPSKSDNIQFVLEVPQGWFKRNNIAPGTVVRTQFGELKSTFSFRAAP
jgi:uncharacterized membrane protein (UPF0127 family)